MDEDRRQLVRIVDGAGEPLQIARVCGHEQQAVDRIEAGARDEGGDDPDRLLGSANGAVDDEEQDGIEHQASQVIHRAAGIRRPELAQCDPHDQEHEHVGRARVVGAEFAPRVLPRRHSGDPRDRQE